VVLTYINSILL